MSAYSPTNIRIASRAKIREIILAVLAVLLTAALLFPFYMVLNYSLMDQVDRYTDPPPIFPPKITFEGYQAASEVVGEYIRTSLIYGFGTVLLAMAIATPAAYGLARMRSRASLIMLMVLLLAQMAPGIVVANSLYALFSKLGILNTYIAVILAEPPPRCRLPSSSCALSCLHPKGDVGSRHGRWRGHWTVFSAIIVPISRTAIITASLFAFLGWVNIIWR